MKLAYELAIENDYITSDMVEVSEYPDLIRKYQVRGVPKTVVNDTVEFVGALPEAEFVAQVLRGVIPAGLENR
ncbi:MAG: thioredoxin family protein [Acidobacteriia bacterium]|nr:thioredoxin family protein [Terriglobia bacterium]